MNYKILVSSVNTNFLYIISFFLVTVYQNTTNDNDPDESLNLDSLLIHLQVQVTPKWCQFGVAIGVPEDVLQWYSSYPADERLIKVLNYWLNNHQNPTWRDMANVLHDIELNDLAEGIMNVYETGSYTSYGYSYHRFVESMHRSLGKIHYRMFTS